MVKNSNHPPVANNFTPAAFNEDVQGLITLSYSDVDSDLATACTVSALSSVTVTQACACNGAGVCTVGVTGTPLNYNGAASFAFTVTAAGQTSLSTATATLSITAVNDAPVANAITPPAFNEDVQSIITLAYSDVEADLATACTISSLTNVSVTQACACTGAGVCRHFGGARERSAIGLRRHHRCGAGARAHRGRTAGAKNQRRADGRCDEGGAKGGCELKGHAGLPKNGVDGLKRLTSN